MTNPRPVSARAVAQLTVSVLALAGVVVLLGWIHQTAPTRRVTPPGEAPIGAEDRADLPLMTCQRMRSGPFARRLSDRVRPTPVGRARSGQVLACPDAFDPHGGGGPPVVFVGEVVGDVLERAGGAWVLLNDDAYALSYGPLPAHGRRVGTNAGLTVWLPTAVIDVTRLDPGRPGRRGDILRVTGPIHHTDPADGGGLTLRASSARVVADAVPAPAPFRPRQALLAGVLAAGALAAAAYARARR